MQKNDWQVRPVRLAVIVLAVCGFAMPPPAVAAESIAARSEALMRWADDEMAEVLRGLPTGTRMPAPSADAVAHARQLLSGSPLTGQALSQQATGAGGSPPLPGGASNQSPPPITIQLPPHPPESQAPPAQWRPPIQIPDPSAIPSPPLTQAPPQQQQPPIQLPNPSAGASGRPPIEPLTIPLPPHPPESQAPWNQRG